MNWGMRTFSIFSIRDHLAQLVDILISEKPTYNLIAASGGKQAFAIITRQSVMDRHNKVICILKPISSASACKQTQQISHPTHSIWLEKTYLLHARIRQRKPQIQRHGRQIRNIKQKRTEEYKSRYKGTITQSFSMMMSTDMGDLMSQYSS